MLSDTDRELIQQAANALGLRLWEHRGEFYTFPVDDRDAMGTWNPLRHAEDVLYMASKLGISYEFTHDEMSVSAFSVRDLNTIITEPCQSDTLRAICRAMTRVAASMPAAGEIKYHPAGSMR